jgi:hypothetical protein
MTAAAIIAHYERNKLPIPPDVLRELPPQNIPAGKIIFDELKNKGRKIRQPKQPNKTEAEFLLMLQSEWRPDSFFPKLATIKFEGIRLKLADGLTYMPDFFCTRARPDHTKIGSAFIYRPICYESKGPWIDGDAIPKFKMAREIHGCWCDFEMWQKLDGQWNRIH